MGQPLRSRRVLFTGTSEHNIDPKLRLAIPAKYRNLWDQTRDGTAWYCVPWSNGQLRLFTEMMFQGLSDARAKTLAPKEEEAEFESMFYGAAERLEMDSAGRIAIPKSHLELTGLKTEVVIVGVRTRLEVWDRAVWQEKVKVLFPNMARYTKDHGFN